MPRGAARILYVLAKDPVPGLVKTRLCPPLDFARAAALSAAFATDVLLMAGTVREVEARLALAPAPGPVGGGPGPLASRMGLAVEGQGAGDLGKRMARLMRRGLESGPTVLIGTDCPDLPAHAVEAAFAVLERCDVVLGPAADGGYVLVGARRGVSALFEIDAPWSSERVLAATCDALTRTKCAFDLLEPREDVDDARALGTLATRLKRDAGAAAPETARLLAHWRSEGVGF